MSSLLERFTTTILLSLFFLTLVFAFFASNITINADFKKLLPLEHPFLENMMEHKEDLTLGNEVRIVVESGEASVFNAEYLAWIKELTDRIYALPSVDKANIKTLWTPNARWISVTEDGFQGGEIIPADYNGSTDSLDQVRVNILRSAEVGRLVADNYKSTSLFVPLIWGDDQSLDYQALNNALETLRQDSKAKGFELRIIGVAKKIGDLIAGAQQMVFFFLAAVALIFVGLLIYTGSVVVSGVLCGSALLGVIWQLGMVAVLGHFFNMGLDPYSMLVPFLIFAIAISHGLQLYSCAAGVQNERPGLESFRQLRKPAALALSSDAIGFATLAIIPIAAIQDLAITASLGVLCLFATTLIFIPLMIDRFGVSQAFQKKIKERALKTPVWIACSLWLCQGRTRWIALLVFGLIALSGAYISQDLQIGDLRPGAPELKSDSQYNQDIEFFVNNYSQSVDVYVVLVRTPPNLCNAPSTLRAIDSLQWELGQIDQVQNTFSLGDAVKKVQQGLNEGFPKWGHIPSDQVVVNGTTANLPDGFMNLDCSFTPVYVFLKDHKAKTLAAVTQVVQDFNQRLSASSDTNIQILPAAGNAGIEAAVNESIDQQQLLMLIIIYAVVLILCWLTFRRIGIVLAILVPLAMTSVLCQALMTLLGIGVKVSTLPVIALGVGIGVDYGVYICASYLQDGAKKALMGTGRIVGFTGLALAVSVGTWMLSAIQFQADMGALLTFMFIWNMVGALFMLPVLLSFIVIRKGN